MRFLASGTKSKALAAFCAMLASSPPEDTYLLLYYGYVGYDEHVVDALRSWLEDDPEGLRTLTLVVGVHGSDSTSPYALAHGKFESSRLIDQEMDAQALESAVRIIRQLPMVGKDGIDRAEIVTVDYGHAKLAVLMQEDASEDAIAFDNLSTPSIHMKACEAIFGSSNLSSNALSCNHEFDAHLERGDTHLLSEFTAELSELMSMRRRASRAAETTIDADCLRAVNKVAQAQESARAREEASRARSESGFD